MTTVFTILLGKTSSFKPKIKISFDNSIYSTQSSCQLQILLKPWCMIFLQEPKTPIASIPLPGNKVNKHPVEAGETGKFKFEIVCK